MGVYVKCLGIYFEVFEDFSSSGLRSIEVHSPWNPIDCFSTTEFNSDSCCCGIGVETPIPSLFGLAFPTPIAPISVYIAAPRRVRSGSSSFPLSFVHTLCTAFVPSLHLHA